TRRRGYTNEGEVPICVASMQGEIHSPVRVWTSSEYDALATELHRTLTSMVARITPPTTSANRQPDAIIVVGALAVVYDRAVVGFHHRRSGARPAVPAS